MYFFEAVKKRGLLPNLEFRDVKSVTPSNYRLLLEKYLANYAGEVPLA